MRPHSVFLLVWLSLGVACAGTRGPASGTKKSWAEQTLSTLTLPQKVGQLIYPRSDGRFVSESSPEFRTLLDAVREGRIGGVVFFKGDPFETAALANRLQEESRLPLLMASDTEWGAAMRVEGATRFPRAMVLGAGGTEDDMEFQAEVTAREARALGIHLLLNPVVDVNTNPENAVIDTRSFGESPERVAVLGAAFIRRAQKLGVLTTAKHFPGHGGTTLDSHVALPLVHETREELERTNLIPFQAAVDAGVAAVMTAHVAVPALDRGLRRPATLSPDILEGVLRGQLGFRGLIVSDALDMGGAREGAWDGEVAASALAAGVDMLLVPPDPLVTFHAVLRAVARGDIPEERIDTAVRRVLEAKERLELERSRTVDLRNLPRRLQSVSVSERVEEVAARGITLIQNRDELLPLRSEKPPDILLVSVVHASDPDVDPNLLAVELERRAGSVRHVTTDSLAPEECARAELVVVASYLRSRSQLERGEFSPNFLAMLRKRVAAGGRVIFASLGTPYLLSALPEATALLAAYDFAPSSQRALAAALFGERGVSGKLPVTLSAEYPLGTGVELEERRMQLQKTKDPGDVGFSKPGLSKVAQVVEDAIRDQAAPGAVYLVARRGRIVLEGAAGRMTYDDDADPVTTETLYDLASLTKIVATTTLSMIYYERGLLDLESPVQSYVPEFRGEQKSTVLVKDLLAHSGGLLWWTDFYKQFEGKTPDDARRGYLEKIYAMPLDYEPRSKTVYSDLGILLLGEVLQRITGKSLETMAGEEIFEPLGMDETFFRPDPSLLPRIAPTEKDDWRGRVVHGEVHDENAYGLGGVAPHAGLFSTARSLARFAQMILNGGVYDGKRILNAETIALFTRRANLVPDSSRALGWDTPSEPSAAGKLFSASSYGHTGFTGTSLWIDPERELFAILLTNRVHPTRENRKIFDLRPAFHDAVQQAVVDR